MGDFIIEKPRKLKKSKIKKGKSGSTDAPKRQKSKNGSKPSSKHSKATLYKKKFVDDTFVEVSLYIFTKTFFYKTKPPVNDKNYSFR